MTVIRNGHEADTRAEDAFENVENIIVLGSLARKALSPNERVALLLRFGLDGYGYRTFREVADLVGEPYPTVNTRVRSGMEKLRAMNRKTKRAELPAVELVQSQVVDLGPTLEERQRNIEAATAELEAVWAADYPDHVNYKKPIHEPGRIPGEVYLG